MDIHYVEGGICAAKGFKAAGVYSGIRQNKNKPDLALILSDTECAAASVYTQNKVQGAPIAITKQNIANGRAWGVLCNSGNANTCNPGGEALARQCCTLAALATGRLPEDFIIASTGVIGQLLPLAPFEQGIPLAVQQLAYTGSASAAHAIMTTDTRRKEFSVEFTLGGKTCRMGAIGKGSGMINPNMATMLVFITTDAAISPALLQQALQNEIRASLNQINVDGDTSTNDMTSILANGLAGNPLIQTEGEDYTAFCAALHHIAVCMSRALAADGEGATKLLECHVTNAPTVTLARAIAKSVISSDLLKSAMFGADANWGRVLCAIGYTPGDFSISNVSLVLKSRAGQVHVCENAAYHPFSEETAAQVLAETEIEILVDMGSGSAEGWAWGCDLTYDYVKINGDYRS